MNRLRETLAKDKMPLNLKATYDRSINGLENYLAMMGSLIIQVNWNRKVTNSMLKYQQDLGGIDADLHHTESLVD